jgi:hypothetical protein
MHPPTTPAPAPATPTRHLSNGESIRRTAAAISLILSPALLTAAFVVLPTTASDPTAALEIIAKQPTRWYLFGLFGLLSYLLLVPATLGLVHLAHRRSPAWANVGGALALLGAITAVADTRLWVFGQQQMATPGADRAQMVALISRLDDAMGANLPFILGALALVIGTVVLAVGLYPPAPSPPGHVSRSAPGPPAASPHGSPAARPPWSPHPLPSSWDMGGSVSVSCGSPTRPGNAASPCASTARR